MATQKQRIEELEAEVKRLDFKCEALWMLLRTLFQLTSPQTALTSERVNEILTAWKNQSPPEPGSVPPGFYDELQLELMPHLERFFSDLAKRLQPRNPRRDQKPDL